MERFSISFEDRQQLFHTELVRVGIDFHQAERVANLLAKNLDEQLTPEEYQLVQTVCKQWLTQRKRLNFISQVLNKNEFKITKNNSKTSLARQVWIKD